MIGNYIVTLAFVFSLFSMIMYYLNSRGVKNTLNYARIGYHATTVLVIVASTYLLHAILTHNYEFKYIFNNSNGDLPTGYLISTFWAGQEGSFLFWILTAVITGLFVQSYTQKRENLESGVMFAYTFGVAFLLLLITPLMKNPFELIWQAENFVSFDKLNPELVNLPVIKQFVTMDNSGIIVNPALMAALNEVHISINELIIDGRGLNPLLQNFWMQIHPPILFIGFAMAAVPYSFAIGAMFKNDYQNWVRQSLPWVIAASGMLGLGIMLGGYWSYGVLGWGGYWAWDPVENSSLVPWIVSVAVIHTMLVQLKTQKSGKNQGKFLKTNIVLSILMFVLVIYSTFLTRSGILADASVHSFVEAESLPKTFLLLFIVTALLIGFIPYVKRLKEINKVSKPEDQFLSREMALFAGTAILTASALIVLVGTSAPIFGPVVETSFYDTMHIPIVIVMGFLNGLSFLLKWKVTKKEHIWKRSRFSIIASVVLTVLAAVLGGVTNILLLLIILTAAFTLFVNLETAYYIARGNKLKTGAYIAHIGFAIFLFGVVASSSYSEEKTIDLPKGKPVDLFGYNATFTGAEPIEGGKKWAFKVDIDDGGEQITAAPVMYISDVNNSMMREPHIIEGFMKDLYLAPLGYDEQGGSHEHGNTQTFSAELGDTIFYQGAAIIYSDYIPPDMEVMMAGGDFSMGITVTVGKEGEIYEADVLIQNKGGSKNLIPAELPEAGLEIYLNAMDPMSRVAQLEISETGGSEHTTTAGEVLTISFAVKPLVSLVWIGVLILTAGFFVTTIRRLKEASTK